MWVHCVQNWTLGARAFSSDLGQLSAAVETPWLLYVPFFCGTALGGNVYENHSVAGVVGSGYKFVQSVGGGSQFAEPHPSDALRFYDDLFSYGIANGMRGFENDFLNFNLLSIPYFRQNYNASTEWLRAMNTAAVKHKIPIQLCMSLPSDLMESLNMEAATNYRSSGE